MAIVVLGFLILAVFAILYFTLKTQIKNLRKANKEYLTTITVLKSRRDMDLKNLKSFLTQDPIAAYQLLQTHVTEAEKRKD